MEFKSSIATPRYKASERVSSFPPISVLLTPRRHPNAYQRRSRTPQPLVQPQAGGLSPRLHTVRQPAPATLEAEYRWTTKEISEVTRNARNISAKLKQWNDLDVAGLQKAARDVLSHMDRDSENVESCREFKKLLKDFKSDAEATEPAQLGALESHCEDGIVFQEMVSQSSQMIRDVYENHVRKYFQSFAEESRDTDVQSALDYENKIATYNADMAENLKKLDDCLESFWELKTPFVTGFLENTPKLSPLMSDACTLLTTLSDVLRRWTLDDRRYPTKLWEEVTATNGDRSKSLEEMNKFNKKQEELVNSKQKKEIVKNKIEQKLTQATKERRKVVNSGIQLKERREHIQEEINRQYADLCENEETIKTRKSNSPKYLEGLWAKSEQLKQSISRLEERVDAFQRQIDRFKSSEEEFDAAIADITSEFYIQSEAVDQLHQRLLELQGRISERRQQLVATEAKIRAAKKIRDIKLAPSTIRKIFFERFGPGVKDDLGDACRFVSQSIGSSWRDLYQELPFRPPRDRDKRITDVEKVYVTCLRKDQTAEEQAWQSLLKWRVFHRHGNVQQLAKALKRIKKVTLARRLEDRHLARSV